MRKYVNMAHFESLTLVGPPASGLERASSVLFEPQYAGRILIPQLVISQPFHPGADKFPLPVIHLDEQEFVEGVNSGAINPHWRRITDYGKPKELFGYLNESTEDPKLLRVNIANPYIARHENPSTEAEMKRTLLVAFNASWAIRLARLTERLGSEKEAEEYMRSQTSDLDLIPYGIATMATIDTGIDPRTGKETEPNHGRIELRKILDRLLNLRQERLLSA